MIDKDLSKIANQAGLKVFADDKGVYIKHTFQVVEKSTWGVLIFLFGGLFLIIAPFIKTSDNTTKVIGVVMGLSLVAFSISTIIKQVTDGLQIKDHVLIFRYNLKRTIIPLNVKMNIKMTTEVMKIRRVGTLGSDWMIVTLFLEDLDKETPILKFQMENEKADEAKALGAELTRLIEAKIAAPVFIQTSKNCRKES